MKFLLVFLLVVGMGYGLFTQRQQIKTLEAALADATGKITALQQKVNAAGAAAQRVATPNPLDLSSPNGAPSTGGSALDRPASSDRKH